MEFGLKRGIEELRSDIYVLQAPGELHIRSRIHNSYEAAPLSPDERRGGYSYHSQRESLYLVVGGQKQEHAYGLSDGYSGGKEFIIASHEIGTGGHTGRMTDADAEGCRQKLLQYRREELRQRIRLPWGDMNGLTDEERTEYNARREMCIQGIEEEWRREDEEALAVRFGDYHAYESESESLREARALATRAYEESRRWRLDISLPPVGEIGNDPLEVLKEREQALRVYADEVHRLVAERLERYDAIEFASVEERDRAMEAEPIPAPWFLHGIPEKDIEKYGRKPGEGFGKRVIGKPLLFLPGSKPVVGFHMDGRSNRYGKQIFYSGLTSLTSGDVQSLPLSHGGRFGVDILALVEDPLWCIRWIETHDGNPQLYGLASAKGIATLYPGYAMRGDQVVAKGWDATPITDISAEEIRDAHGLPAFFSRTEATPVVSTEFQQGISEPALGSGAFASLFAQKNTAKEVKTPVVEKPAPAVQEKNIERRLSDPERAEVLREVKEELLYIHGIFRGIPAKPYHAPEAKQEGELLAKASTFVKEKRADIFLTLTELKSLGEEDALRTTKDRDSLLGKIAALKKTVERLAVSKEAVLLGGQLVAGNWINVFGDVWKSIPDVVRAEVNGMGIDESIPLIIQKVQEHVSLNTANIQQGKTMNLKAIIEEVAIEYLT